LGDNKGWEKSDGSKLKKLTHTWGTAKKSGGKKKKKGKESERGGGEWKINLGTPRCGGERLGLYADGPGKVLRDRGEKSPGTKLGKIRSGEEATQFKENFRHPGQRQ